MRTLLQSRGLKLAALCAGCLALGAGPAAASARRTPVVEAVEKALPSVVNIGTERMVQVLHNDPGQSARGDIIDQALRQFFGPAAGAAVPDNGPAHSLGSGVIIDASGYILTNYHVIERASVIRVTLANDQPFTGRFIAGDEVSDLALIKIDAPFPLPAVEFARDGDLLLGETVIALGNPFGLGHSVTVGVLSAKNREARYGSQVLFRDILQTDAAVNPGSSGGPLLNIDGQMIGVNVAIYQEAQNIGFAVPAGRVRALVAAWLAPRTLNKLQTGLEWGEKEGRVVVARVETNGPAAGANIRAGDAILGANGRAVGSLLDLHRALVGAKAGETVQFALERNPGEAFTAAIVLAAIPRPDGAKLAFEHLGLKFGDPTAAPGRFRKGLPIAAVRPGSVGEKTGFQPGLWLTRINNVDIQTPDDAAMALENVQAGQAVAVIVMKVQEQGNFLTAQMSSAQVAAE